MDDSRILMETNGDNGRYLKHSLDSYCINVGQLISAKKCSIICSTNTSIDNRVEVCEVLSIFGQNLVDKYLGL
jgi:hypothetical protein